MTDDATLECPQVLAVSDGLSSLINLFSDAQMVICDWNLRTPRNFHRWKAHHWSLSHDQCGGVSDITVKVTVLVSPLIGDSFQLQMGDTLGSAPPPSSLNGILDVKVRGADLPHEPRLEVLSTPVVKEIQPNVYHYKGLYPTSVREPEFFVPCVFSPGKWVRRSLQAFELLRVFDVPSSIEKALSHRQSKALIPFLSRPNKCLSRVIQFLFVSHTGGGFSSPESPSGAAVGFEPSATPTDLPINWNANEAHNKDERAAKSDDAEVPVHLWHNHLSTLLNMQLFGDTHIKGLNTLRKFILVVWRKSITKCFCSWIRCKGCHNDRMRKRFPGVFIYEEYNPGHSSFCMSNKSYKNCVVWKDNKYFWHGKKGYQAWWKIIYSSNSSTDRSKSLEAFGECVNKAAKATEWKWDGGSRTFFWRWGENWRSSRDGAKVHVQNKLPNCRDKQSVPKDDNVKLKMKEKLSDVRSKGYIRGGGEVKSLTSFFAVPKSDDDIRMVYNGTSSGLNDAVWAPWFALPTVDTHMRSTVPGTYMCDIDLSEMFLNFMLDEDIRPYAGVDFSKFFADEIKEGNFTLWEMWVRLLMGFKPSPYLSTRDMRRIEEFLTGDRNNPTNPFRWSKVVFNLPGSKNYNPSLPRVYRIRIEGTIAGDLFIYIDDLRVTCPTRKECWEGAHQVCCRLTWLGLQDAPRKRSEVSTVPRAWAGSIVHTDNDVVTVLIAEKKWNKAKGWIQWLASCLDVSNKLNHKELEKCRGFLIYVSRTYKSMRPYLRGLHMTIENWRSNRDDEGWKLINIMKKIDVDQDSEIPNLVNATQDIKTEFVKAVPRLHDDVKMLSKLTRTEAPPKVRRRRSKVGKAYYGFGDASGSGFGYAVQIEKIIYDEYGEWNSCICEKSSNYRELRNLVNAVKRMCSEGLMTDVELYLFTDNYVAERAYYNGGSSNSRDLDDLVFQLWDIQMHYDFDLFLYHVAGTRMIECGVDGLSRGDKGEGIARGIPVIDFVPIHLSPMERSSQLENWIYTWWKDSEELGELRKMEPIDWFTNYNKRGAFLWDVAPAAGESAVEQLSAHIHAQPYADHIFLIPRLCTSHYRKQLLKACDVVITLKPAECVYWPTNMHEPLLFGIYFSLLPHSRMRLGNLSTLSGWNLKDVTCRRCKLKVNHWTGVVCGNYSNYRGRFPPCLNAWHGKCYQQRSLDKYPVAKLADTDEEDVEDDEEANKFKCARNGDHLLTPFQCDLCQFRNVFKRDPMANVVTDERAIIAIRRAILDTFWARTKNTVDRNRASVKKLLEFGVGAYCLPDVLPPMGPHPIEDNWGMGIALIVLRKSLDKGKYSETVQYDTARRIRSAYSNVWGASIHCMTNGVMARDTMKSFLTQCPTYSLWFERFMRGMHSRMGDDHRPDLALSKEVLHMIMTLLDEDYSEASTTMRKRYIARMGLLLLSTYLAALRGEEVPRIVRKYFIELNEESMNCGIPHCVLPLYGRFKNEGNVPRCHLFRVCKRSKSGFDMEKWVLRVIHHEKNSRTLYLFSTADGKKESVGKTYEAYFFNLLKEVQEKSHGLIPKKLDVEEAYGISRSGRRGGTTGAQNAPNEECNDQDIERNNRWRSEERAGSRKPSSSMIQLYTDSLYSLEADLRFSKCQ